MTPKPRSIKFWAIGRPILPRPITPTLSIPKLYAVWALGGKGSDGETACSFGLRDDPEPRPGRFKGYSSGRWVNELRACPCAISYRAALCGDQGTAHTAAGGRRGPCPHYALWHQRRYRTAGV